jgi:DNA replication protein DnaC
MSPAITHDGLIVRLRGLKLPAFVSHHGDLATRAEREGWGFLRFLGELVELEHQERQVRRIDRLRKSSGLDPDKTLARLDLTRLPAKVRRQVPTLCEGGFVERAENLLAFGLPGRGKSHLLSAIGHELVNRGYSVLFVPTFKLVQQLLQAKRDLTLLAAMRRLDHFDVVFLDDIGYTQQNREEMEVLFNFLAERYERRSVMITSNLVFSQWDRIFKDAMTTAAAIDRLVHHSIILELTGRSYRGDEAEQRNQPAKRDATAKAAAAEQVET